MIEWGCPKCKFKSSKVVDTDTDDDGFRVRKRRCLACGTFWATEEIPMAVEFFRLRIGEKRADYERKARRHGSKRCAHCGYMYRRGYYQAHVKEQRHLNRIDHPRDEQERAQHRQKTYDRYWRRKREQDRGF